MVLARSCVAGDGGGARLVEARREALVLLVRRELDHAAVDQLLVDLSPLDEVVEVGVELAVAEHDRDAHLVAARELDVHARRVLRARREAGVEGRLVPVEVDAGRGLAAVPLRLGRVERGARRGRQREQRSTTRRAARLTCVPPRATPSSVPLSIGPSSAAEGGHVLQLVVADEGTALEEPELSLDEAELDVPRPRLPGRVARRLERVVDLAAGADELGRAPSARARGRCPSRRRSALAAVGLEQRRHGDLNSVTSSTPCGRPEERLRRRPVDGAADALGGRDQHLRRARRSPASAVTSTPDFSDGTDSRITTDGSTQSGSSISVCRQENER